MNMIRIYYIHQQHNLNQTLDTDKTTGNMQLYRLTPWPTNWQTNWSKTSSSTSSKQTDQASTLYLAPMVQDGWLLATHSQKPCHADHPLCGTHLSHVMSLHSETKSMRRTRQLSWSTCGSNSHKVPYQIQLLINQNSLYMCVSVQTCPYFSLSFKSENMNKMIPKVIRKIAFITPIA